MAFDQARHRTVLFGGLDWASGDTPVGDTWEWDGAAWSLRSTSGPTPRWQHAMAYNGVTGRVVLFGGRSASGALLGDTWEWNGSAWIFMTDSEPTPRAGHAMARFSFSHAVMFSGYYESGLAGTWTWNGSTWHRWFGEPQPIERMEHAMGFQPSPSLCVLFGGRSGQQYLRDTWRWFGNGWELLATTGPTARIGHAMAGLRDPTGGPGAIALFGGWDGSLRGDTWLWTGSSWVEQAATGPIERYFHAMSLDDQVAASRALLFGGMGPSGALDDTWELELQTAPTIVLPPVSQTACAGDAVTFSVQVSGSSPFSYVWRLNGSPIPGAPNAAAYTIDLVLPQHAGDYDVVVTNACGEVASEAATLTVQLPPTITQQPDDQEVTAGGTAVFSVSAMGDAPLSYQWRRQAMPLQDDGRIYGAATDTLTINTVQEADAGQYDVVVTNPCGSLISAAAMLTVIHCPGDLDGDGFRNVTDFALFATAYGSQIGWPDYNPDADMNGDGVVNLTDFPQFAAVYGMPCP